MADNKNNLINPFTEEVYKSFEFESEESVRNKLAKADEAFREWSQLEVQERKKYFEKLHQSISEMREDFVQAMTKDMGKTAADGNAEVDTCLNIIQYCIDEVENILEKKSRPLEEGKAFNVFSPLGVIFSIQPWNFPMYQVIRYAIPALLVGNTTLLRHASNVWGSAELLEKAFKKAGFPEGVFTHLYAEHESTEFLYNDERVKMVTFTGSPETGKGVAEKAAKNLKKSLLELGGNDAYLVLADADLEEAAKACVKGRLYNSSETCTAAKRFIVVDEVYDKFRDLLVAEMKKVKMGDPTSESTDIGPLSKKDLLETVESQVSESVEKGAKILCGGSRAKDKTGYFYEPTVIENLKAGMPAYDDEIFGPVASLIRAKNIEDAIEISNASKFGLGGGIFSSDIDQAFEIASKRLDTGMININGYTNEKAHLPFGGVKQSGYGREHGHAGFYEYMNVKSVRIIENHQ